MSNYRHFSQGERHIDRLFNTWVLIMMLNGILFFSEDGVPVELAAGEWYIQRPGLAHRGNRPCPSPCYFYIHFDACEMDARKLGFTILENGNYRKPSSALLTLPVRGRFNPSNFVPFFDQMERLKLMRPADLFAQQAVFLEILSMLSEIGSARQTGGEQLAKAALDYLSIHFCEDIKINALSGHFHFTGQYLSKTIRKYYSVSPKEHVQRLRMNRAMELLITTDMPVAQVAEAVGYNDTTTFFRTFKKHTDMSPIAWRDSLIRRSSQ